MYAIIDVETTGYGPRGNKITEIAIFIHDGVKVIDEYCTLVNPESPIPYKITQLTGIDDDMVRDAPKFYEVAKKVFQITEGCVFVAHNVSFDYGVIRAEFKELGAEYIRKKLCTVRLSRKLIPESPRHSLGNLCRFLDIEINGRHRARGDAAATVQLFDILRERDEQGLVETSLNARSREASLPPNLDRQYIDALPNRPGVYYFKNAEGKDIYIGKAKQIKKRVMSHFHSKARKERRIFESTHKVNFTETGNELVALLLESDEIKRKYPLFNTAQKRSVESYAVFSYEDRMGVMHLGYGKSNQVTDAKQRFYSISQARSFLETLCETFDLCPRYCQLQSSKGACFHFGLKKCRGVCARKEEVDTYNQRVNEALASIPNLQGDLVIFEKGRSIDEESFVLIEKGLYKGFGYYHKDSRPQSLPEFLEHLRPMRDNSDIQRLIRSYLRKTEEASLSYFELDGLLLEA